MAKIDFINQLKLLGYTPQQPSPDKVYFEWTVPVGVNIGKKILMGFIIDDRFPLGFPTGPHIKTVDPHWKEHPLNIHNRQFGHNWTTYPVDQPIGFYRDGWRYWSRPFEGGQNKTVKEYLAHIKNIMMTV